MSKIVFIGVSERGNKENNEEKFVKETIWNDFPN